MYSKYIFSIPQLVVFFIEPKTYQPPSESIPLHASKSYSCLTHYSILKMEAVHFSETSVDFYRITLRYSLEDGILCCIFSSSRFYVCK
jgi:hypothetical protein